MTCGCAYTRSLAFAIAILVYPIYSWLAAESRRGRRVAATAPAVSTVVPCTVLWYTALWGAGRFVWGVASGTWVGVFCACITLKAVSYVQSCVPVSEASRPEKADEAFLRHDIGNGRATSNHGAIAVHAAEIPAQTAAANPVLSDDRDNSCCLTFKEFVFFMLLAPTLVCQPALLKNHARVAPRPWRAAVEIFHAGLAYLALHASLAALYAPTLRVLAGALHSSWADADGWAAVRADGSGQWLFALVGGDASSPSGWLVVVAASAGAVCALCPMTQFLFFYSFWHCVCLGCAELWGYPDRHLYGEA